MSDYGTRQAALGGWLRLFTLLGLTVGALLVIFRQTPSEEAMAILPFVCCAFIAFLAPVFVSERTGLFSPPGLIGLNGGLATAAMMAYILDEGGVRFDALGIMMQEQRIDLARRAAILILVSHLAYLFGYYRFKGTLAARFFPDVGTRRWQGGKMLVAVVAMGLMVVPFYYLFQQRMGGAALLDVTELGRGKAVIREDPTLSWMARGIMFAFVPALLLAGMAILDRSKRLLVIAGVVFLLASVLVTRLGPRQPAFSAGLMILILFNYLWRKVSASLVVGLLLLAVVTVNVLGTYRSAASYEVSDERRARFGQGVANPVESMARHEDDRSRLQVLGIVLYYFPEREDYLLGESYVSLSVSWIPLWVWPDKNKMFEWQGHRIAQKLTGLPAPVPLHGELYANFSWIGVLIGMALFGAFHRALAQYREASPNDLGTALIYAVVATQFTPTAMGISATAQYLLPLMILIYLVSRRERSPVMQPGGRAVVV
jgi:Ca2+/Na+ antiporter